MVEHLRILRCAPAYQNGWAPSPLSSEEAPDSSIRRVFHRPPKVFGCREVLNAVCVWRFHSFVSSVQGVTEEVEVSVSSSLARPPSSFTVICDNAELRNFY